MKEMIQAGNFYNSLKEDERKDLIDAIAEDIVFLDDRLQRGVMDILNRVSPGFGDEVAKRNNFTILYVL